MSKTYIDMVTSISFRERVIMAEERLNPEGYSYITIDTENNITLREYNPDKKKPIHTITLYDREVQPLLLHLLKYEASKIKG